MRPTPAPPPVVLHPSAVQVAAAQKHLAALDQTVLQPGPEPRPLRLSENDLNVILASSKPLRKLLSSRGVGAVQIVLEEPNVVIVHASVRVQGRKQNVQMSGALTPDPKTGIRFAVSGVRAGRFPLPPALVNAQANQIAARFTLPLLRRLALSVQSVSIEKKELVIVGVPAKSAPPQSASPARH